MTYTGYSTQAGDIVLAAGGFVSDATANYCADSATNLGRMAQIEDDTATGDSVEDVVKVLFTEGEEVGGVWIPDSTKYTCAAGVVSAGDVNDIGDWAPALNTAFGKIVESLGGANSVTTTVSLANGRIDNEQAVLNLLLDNFVASGSANPELTAFKRAVLAESIHTYIDNVDTAINAKCDIIANAQGGSGANATLTAARSAASTEANAAYSRISQLTADATCTAGESDPSVFSLDDMALANDARCSSDELEDLAEQIDDEIAGAYYLSNMTAYCTAIQACKSPDCSLPVGEHTVYQGFVTKTKTPDQWDDDVTGYTNKNRLDDVTSNADLLELNC